MRVLILILGIVAIAATAIHVLVRLSDEPEAGACAWPTTTVAQLRANQTPECRRAQAFCDQALRVGYYSCAVPTPRDRRPIWSVRDNVTGKDVLINDGRGRPPHYEASDEPAYQCPWPPASKQPNEGCQKVSDFCNAAPVEWRVCSLNVMGRVYQFEAPR